MKSKAPIRNDFKIRQIRLIRRLLAKKARNPGSDSVLGSH
jgi:hypothetical protein